MPHPNCPDCGGTGVVVAGDLLGNPRPRPCALCKAWDEAWDKQESALNPYLSPLLERVPTEWTPLSEIDAPFEHLDELALSGHLEQRVETITDECGIKRGSRHYYRRPKETS